MLDRLPQGFNEILQEVATAKDSEQIQKACSHLIDCVDAFLKATKGEVIQPVPMSHFKGLYEEISSHWNKIRYCVEKGDAFSAFLAATNLQAELNYVQEQTGVHRSNLNFIDQYDPDNLASFVLAANKAEETFIKILKANNIPIIRFTHVEDLKDKLLQK